MRSVVEVRLPAFPRRGVPGLGQFETPGPPRVRIAPAASMKSDKAGPEKKKEEPALPAEERLDSWKEIASYLKRAVRTVQRWEKEERLPVRRHQHRSGGSVYASKPELDAWWNQKERREKEDAAAKDAFEEAAIAVLPFANLSSDADNEYFADGMTEELISALTRAPGLRVVPRTSVLEFKGKSGMIGEIRRRFKVGTVLEGSVRRAGGRIRVGVQLIDAEREFSIWSQTWDREARDVFALQDEIGRAIAETLSLELTGGGRGGSRKTRSLPAYEAYLRGRELWNRRGRLDLERAIELFTEAVGLDPGYAPAYAGLADCRNMLGYYSYRAPREVFPAAREAALEALRLDDGLAEAHASLGFARMFYEWDWEGSEKAFRRAIQLRPDYAVAHCWLGLNLGPLGRPFEAIEHIRTAQESEPASPVVNAYVAGAYYFARQYDQAVAKCLTVLKNDPDFGPARFFLGLAYRQKELFDLAEAELTEAAALQEGSSDAEAALGHLYAVAGRIEEARETVSRLSASIGSRYVSPGHIAVVQAGLGRTGEALDWLEKAYDERYPWLPLAKADPVFDVLRAEPRFHLLLRRIGLGN